MATTGVPGPLPPSVRGETLAAVQRDEGDGVLDEGLDLLGGQVLLQESDATTGGCRSSHAFPFRPALVTVDRLEDKIRTLVIGKAFRKARMSPTGFLRSTSDR